MMLGTHQKPEFKEDDCPSDALLSLIKKRRTTTESTMRANCAD